MVTDSCPPFATEMIPGRTDANHEQTPNFFTTASAPAMRVEWPPETFEPWTCPFLFPNPIFKFFQAKDGWDSRLPVLRSSRYRQQGHCVRLEAGSIRTEARRSDDLTVTNPSRLPGSVN